MSRESRLASAIIRISQNKDIPLISSRDPQVWVRVSSLIKGYPPNFVEGATISSRESRLPSAIVSVEPTIISCEGKHPSAIV